MARKLSHLASAMLCVFATVGGQNALAEAPKSELFDGLELRNIGSAFKSGRIADIAVDPTNPAVWYVAVGSGGVWKTTNAGTTWAPVFDDQAVYSTGAITVDPQRPQTVWLGTGENVGGRHLSFGDGLYRSEDGGKTWKNMGLKKSEHISKIIVHPTNSDVVWVAAQGPLWSSGGERGLYKTIDGGKTWEKTLGDDKWTGVTDLLIDPRNPDVLYAATWDRHRTVAAYMGGGKGTAIHKSTDGGKTWNKLSNGLPSSRLGKVGLAMSPQKPDVLYAAIELDRRSGAVFRSDNGGASWTKGAKIAGGGTGPHYYTELYANPHKFDEIYMADVWMKVSTDGGKTFKTMPEKAKHSDNHAMVFHPTNPNYRLVGSDGGLYESYDSGNNWRHINNMPITQFYKVAVDDKQPFYHVYGGTQDNNSQGGPSRTDSAHGILNSDWYVTLFGDGHQPATEPGNPDIFYSEWQQGNLARMDKSSNSIVYIQPQAAPGEPAERFNWDAPILVSPHNPTRLYFASQRLWRSDDRGDSWTAISGDLTRNLARIEQPIMGKQQSWDNAWDIYAMSNFSTVTSVSESPKKEGLIYVGTDDGLVQVTENGGKTWRKIPVDDLKGVPETAFVNDIKADLHDPDTVYIALDNHKYGDYTPYLLKSTNRGKSWKPISKTLPEKHLVWRIVQDHVNPKLLFTATEFGLFFTVDGGKNWTELNGGVPTISFRDLAIQKRENDLVAASFGRGFFVLDDYSALREINEDMLKEKAKIFPVRKAWWYLERHQLDFGGEGSAGAQMFKADNPPFGAVFTYYLKDVPKTIKSTRKANEKALEKKDKDISFPGWEALEAEKRQQKATLVFTVRDQDDNVVRRLTAPAKKGVNRIDWDLSYPSLSAITGQAGHGQDDDDDSGYLAAPGQYSVSMAMRFNGKVEQLAAPVKFDVERLNTPKLKGAEPKAVVAFWKDVAQTQRQAGAVANTLGATMKRVKLLEQAMQNSLAAPGELEPKLHQLRETLFALNKRFNGSPAKAEVGEKDPATIQDRIFTANFGTLLSTYGPTPTHKRSLEIAKQELKAFQADLQKLLDGDIAAFEKLLEANGAPWIKGQALPSEE